jgi:spore coat protein U-like protein
MPPSIFIPVERLHKTNNNEQLTYNLYRDYRVNFGKVLTHQWINSPKLIFF